MALKTVDGVHCLRFGHSEELKTKQSQTQNSVQSIQQPPTARGLGSMRAAITTQVGGYGASEARGWASVKNDVYLTTVLLLFKINA